MGTLRSNGLVALSRTIGRLVDPTVGELGDRCFAMAATPA